jgi:hypothetical protein
MYYNKFPLKTRQIYHLYHPLCFCETILLNHYDQLHLHHIV